MTTPDVPAPGTYRIEFVADQGPDPALKAVGTITLRTRSPELVRLPDRAGRPRPHVLEPLWGFGDVEDLDSVGVMILGS